MSERLRPEWIELFKYEGKRTTLYLYENASSGAIDLVQINDRGESITTRLDKRNVESMIDSLA